MISKSLEDYLKNIYIIKKQNGNVRVTDIAEKMNCTKPSVNKAINNLKAEGFLNYEAYGSIELTQNGIELAKKILETYDIVYIFLKDVLNLDEIEAKNQAEQIKSVISDNTINRLAIYVHDVLDLNDLNCGYDINNKRCRECSRREERKINFKA